MLRRIGAYVSSRARDPVAWISIPFLLPWIAAIVFGISPFMVLNGVLFAAAAGEWAWIWLWRKREKRLRREVVDELAHALDRWKPAALGIVGLLTIAGELWIDSIAPSFLGYGVTALGISSFVTLWYAWSRPLLVTENGLVVGASVIPWSGVERVVVEGQEAGGTVRVDFVQPHFIYGTKLRAVATNAQIDRIEAIRHTSNESEPRQPQLGYGTA